VAGQKSAFEVRRLVAALESMFWLRTGSLLPFSGETDAWFQARRGNPGSKLPVWGSIRLLKAATSRRTPNAPSALWIMRVKTGLMSRFNTIIAVLGVTLLCAHMGVFAGQQGALPPGFDVKVQVQPQTASVGDPIRIDFDFALPAGFQLKFPNVEPQIGEFTTLEKYPGPSMPGMVEPATSQAQGALQHYRARLIVAVYKTGEFEFPSLAFLLRDPGGKETVAPSPAVKVRIESVLQAGDSRLKDLKKQAEIPEPVRWLLWIGLTAAALVLVSAVWWWRKHCRMPGVSAIPFAPQVDPLDLVEAEFRDLLKRGLVEKGMIKQFYVQISEIIKRALEAGYRVPTVEQTTEEIMEAFARASHDGAARIQPRSLEQIETFLLSCDMVKFARYVPSASEMDDCIQKAGRILAECRARRVSPEASAVPVAGGA
jgi:hypothetical protein